MTANMTDQPQPTISVKEAAALHRTTENAILKQLGRKKLKGYKDGRTWRVYVSGDQPATSQPTPDTMTATSQPRQATDQPPASQPDSLPAAVIEELAALRAKVELLGDEIQYLRRENENKTRIIEQEQKLRLQHKLEEERVLTVAPQEHTIDVPDQTPALPVKRPWWAFWRG